jgi:hypothetical protein
LTNEVDQKNTQKNNEKTLSESECFLNIKLVVGIAGALYQLKRVIFAIHFAV